MLILFQLSFCLDERVFMYFPSPLSHAKMASFVVSIPHGPLAPQFIHSTWYPAAWVDVCGSVVGPRTFVEIIPQNGHKFLVFIYNLNQFFTDVICRDSYHKWLHTIQAKIHYRYAYKIHDALALRYFPNTPHKYHLHGVLLLVTRSSSYDKRHP